MSLPILKSLSRSDQAILADYLTTLEAKIPRVQIAAEPSIKPPVGPQAPQFSKYSKAAATTLSISDLGRTHHINATANFDLTLPTAIEGAWVDIQNIGSSIITVKDGGTLVVLTADTRCSIKCFVTSAGVPRWQTKTWKIGRDSKVTTKDDIIWDTTSFGPVLVDTNSHYWRMTVTTLGVIMMTDLGTSLP